MLLDGEIRGCGTMVVLIGDGVLSLGEVYIDGVDVGPTTLIPIPEAAELSVVSTAWLARGPRAQGRERRTLAGGICA
jgi:hypothetical protein